MQLQYIGARYVPKWYVNSVNQSSDWEVNVEYEALTWVTTQNNHLYLSKKTVPDNIGSPAQNTEYWLDMGEMTGDLQNIQDEIDAITASIGDLSDLDTTDKSSIVAAINEVAGSTPTPTTAGRKFLFLGDSYSIGTQYGQTTTSNGWVDRVINNLGLTSDDYYRCTSADIGALPAFYPTSATHKSWVDTIATMYGNIGATAALSVTDIVLCGGYNETFSPDHTTDEILTPMGQFATYCKNNFPNAKLWLGFIGYNVQPTAAGAAIRQDLNRRVFKCYSRSPQYGFTFMSGTEHCLWYLDDTDGGGVHPTTDCYHIIGDAITNNLLGIRYDSAYNHGTPLRNIFVNSDVTMVDSGAAAVAVEGTVRRISNDHAVFAASPDWVFTHVLMTSTDTSKVIAHIDSDLPINEDFTFFVGLASVLPAGGQASQLALYKMRLTLSPAGDLKLYNDGRMMGTALTAGTACNISLCDNNMSVYLDHNLI